MKSYLFKSIQISKEALKEQALANIMSDMKRVEERADREGWIDADDLERAMKQFNTYREFEVSGKQIQDGKVKDARTSLASMRERYGL